MSKKRSAKYALTQVCLLMPAVVLGISLKYGVGFTKGGKYELESDPFFYWLIIIVWCFIAAIGVVAFTYNFATAFDRVVKRFGGHYNKATLKHAFNYLLDREN